MEILPAVETLQWLAEHGPRILAGERIRFSRTQHPIKRGRWSYEPLGVIGVIGPAAEPFATPLGDVAVALMAGNGVVLKPSPHAALAGERIARIFARAGLPEGLLRVVHGHAATGRGARRVARRPGALHRRAPRRGARSARRARGRSSAACSSSAATTRCSCSPTRTSRAPRAARRGRRSPTPASRGGSVGRAICLHKVADRFLDGRRRRARARCASATRPTRRRRSARSSRASGSSSCARSSTTRVEQGATLHCGGPLEVDGVDGAVLRAGGPDRRRAGDAALARGGARAGARRHEARQRGGGDPARQRLAVRPRRVGVDGRPLQGRAHRARAAGRDGVDERPPRRAQRAAGAVGRRQGLGHRPRARRDRAAHLRRAEGRHLGPADRPPGLVVPLRRDARHARRARSSACARRARPTASRR